MGTQPSVQSPFHKEMFGTRAQKILKTDIKVIRYLVSQFCRGLQFPFYIILLKLKIKRNFNRLYWELP